MLFIGDAAEFKEEKSYPIITGDLKLLLINDENTFYLIENKCGHFGVSLNQASIKNKTISCAHHGISFSLETGLVVNRPYENCNPINVYPLQVNAGSLYCPDL